MSVKKKVVTVDCSITADAQRLARPIDIQREPKATPLPEG